MRPNANIASDTTHTRRKAPPLLSPRFLPPKVDSALCFVVHVLPHAPTRAACEGADSSFLCLISVSADCSGPRKGASLRPFEDSGLGGSGGEKHSGRKLAQDVPRGRHGATGEPACAFQLPRLRTLQLIAFSLVFVLPRS